MKLNHHTKTRDRIFEQAVRKLDTQCLIDLKNMLIGAIRESKLNEKRKVRGGA